MGLSDSETGKQVQIFLSYGRRDASIIADKVSAFLLGEGFRVWRDRPEIKPGVAFLEKIEAAIHESDVVVALLSPHSVRRVGAADDLDSVCLDELSCARFGKPAKPIVPAMVLACEPPMVIFRQDYVDLTSADALAHGLSRLRDGIDEALAGRVRYRSWVHSLKPLDFSSILKEKRQDFVGREWLFAKLNAWLEQPGGQPVLVLKADPGAGKSAFAAALIERNPGALLGYHFCQANAPETLKPGRFVQSMAAMIASRLPLYESRLAGLLEASLDEARCAADPFTAFDEGILAPLNEIDAPAFQPAFLVVDSLDEALVYRGITNRATIFNVLADRIGRFPPWLRIIATTRKDPEVLRKLRGLHCEEIDVHATDNQQDIEAYTRAREARGELKLLLGGNPQGLDKLIHQMREAGNFLFVAQMLNALGQPGASLDDLEHLPPRLYGLYEDFFDRTFARPNRQAQLASARLLLSVILAAQQALSEAELAQVTKLGEEDELPALLKLLAPYLPAREDDEGTPRFAVFHKSFADWLQDPELRGTDYYVSSRPGHQKLAARFLAEYESGLQHLSPYSLAHGPLHLGLAGETQGLYQTLTDAAYIRLAFKRLGPASLLQILDQAATAFAAGSARDTLLTLGKALRLSLPAVTEDPTEFEVQLDARLRAVEQLSAFRNSLRPHFSPEVLIPLGTPLTQAAGPLLLSLKAGFAVCAVCVHAASKQLVTGDEEGQLRVWWLDSGTPVLSTDLSPLAIACGEADPGRPLAAFGSFEGVIIRLDLDTGAVLRRDASELGAVEALDIDPRQQKLLSAHRREAGASMAGAVLACWTWPALEPLWQREMVDESIESIRWSKDASTIYVAAKSRLLRTDDLGEHPATIRTAPRREDGNAVDDSPNHVYSILAVRADGCIALGLDDGRIELLDSASGALYRTLPGHPMDFYTTKVSGLFFAGGDELVSAGWDGAIRVWSTASGEELRSVRGQSKIFSCAVFDNGRKAVSGHKMLATNLWDLTAAGRTGDENLDCASLQVNEACGVAVARIGRCRIAVWTLATLEARHFVFDEPVKCVGLDGEHGEIMVLTSHQIRALPLTAEEPPGRLLDSLKLDHAYISNARWSPNGQILALDVGSKTLLWRRDGKLSSVSLPKGEYTLYSMAIANATLATASSTHLRLRNLHHPRAPVPQAELDTSPGGATFSPDGQTLAIFDGLGNIVGFAAETGERRWRVASHDEWLQNIYLTDSGLVCTTSVDALCIYDTHTGQRIAHLRSENGWAECWLAEDGQTVLAGAGEGELHKLSRS